MHGHFGTAREKAMGFRRLLESATRSGDVSSDAKYLFILLNSYANADGSNCHPSMPRLAQDSLRDIKWVKRHIAELKKAGWIDIGKKKVKTGWVNLYRLLWSGIGPPKYEGGVSPNLGPTGKAQIGPGTNTQLPVGRDCEFDENSPFSPD
jgi:hypothetical protein